MPNIEFNKFIEIPVNMEADDAKKHMIDIKTHLEKPFSKTVVFATANWCGHCKSLKPDLENLKKKTTKKRDGGLIVHIDNVHHDKLKNITKGLEINGFPSIIKLNGDTQFEKYSGGRDIDSLTKLTDNYFSSNISSNVSSNVSTNASGGNQKKYHKSKKNKKRKSHKSKKMRKKRRKTRKKKVISNFLTMFRRFKCSESKIKKYYKTKKKSHNYY